MSTKHRCAWVPEDNELYVRYHDEEWGVPQYDDQRIFEHLTLEASQAGLSWLTILRKRDNYRRAFANFDPKRVAAFTEEDVERLMQNAGIVRNRQKITAAIANAKCFLATQKEWGSFAKYQWQFVGGRPKQNAWETIAEVPAITPEAEAFSRDLKRRGFRFVGPTTIYAHMQAVGMVNDHTTNCFRYSDLIK
jgi:DNA-3-methyladenine glycosylase I